MSHCQRCRRRLAQCGCNKSGGSTGPTGPTGAGITIPGPTGAILFARGDGSVGGFWNFDPATNAVTADNQGAQFVIAEDGVTALCVWDRGLDLLGNFITIGSDHFGTPSTYPTTLYLNAAIRIASELLSASGGTLLFGPGAWAGGTLSGFSVFPNLALGPGGVDQVNSAFAGGEGVFRLRPASPLPDPTTPPADGALIYCNRSGGTLDRLFYILANTGRIGFLDDQFSQYAFPSDANQILGGNDSQSNFFRIIGTGVITATRTLTSQLPPGLNRVVFVKNEDAHDVNWAWATGSAALCPAGKMTIVLSDGANAQAFVSL